eukprot:3382903-Alexandrium_andersonii.AAC.1
MSASLVGSEMCIRDRPCPPRRPLPSGTPASPGLFRAPACGGSPCPEPPARRPFSLSLIHI